MCNDYGNRIPYSAYVQAFGHLKRGPDVAHIHNRRIVMLDRSQWAAWLDPSHPEEDLLAMNSIKHAFGPAGGRISVRLAGGIGYAEGRLIVSDYGRGISKSNPNGSGLMLIAALAGQIGGTVDQQTSEQGRRLPLPFPILT